MNRVWTSIAIALGAVACGGQPPKADVQPTETPIPDAKKADADAEPDAKAPDEGAGDEAAVEPDEPKLTPAQEAGLDRLAEGRRAVADGELDTAAARFRDALSADPQLADAPYNLGVLAEWRGDEGAARR